MTKREPKAAREETDVERVSAQAAGRLAALGIWLAGRETPDELTAIEDAVEQFEVEVETHGGDLMMDEGPPGQTPQPDDPHFALPRRREHEPVAHYLERLARATDTIRRHRPLSE